MRARLGPVLLLALAAASCTASAQESRSATVVLFDVTNSTRSEAVRARYDGTFGLVLGHLREQGGVLGADIIDANPMAHGTLPINETFERCTILDNSLDCRQRLEERERKARAEASAILEHSSQGTDVFGALALAGQFFAAYPDASDRTLVVLSDMVQWTDGMHFDAMKEWPEVRIAELLSRAPSVDLSGVRVYVVGAGATAPAGMTPVQIEGTQRFWTRWFGEMGATVTFYGANLPRFPITSEGAA